MMRLLTNTKQLLSLRNCTKGNLLLFGHGHKNSNGSRAFSWRHVAGGTNITTRSYSLWNSLKDASNSIVTTDGTKEKESKEGDQQSTKKKKRWWEGEEEQKPASTNEILASVLILMAFIGYMVVADTEKSEYVYSEDKCEAKLAADKMPGTVEGCDNIQRVKMSHRIPLELLKTQGISHAVLEGTLWDCKLNCGKGSDGGKVKHCWYRQKYFNDEAAYELSPSAAETLRTATEELHAMCLEAVEAVVESDDLMTLFEIPPNMREAVRESWRKREKDFLGRFDLMWDGRGPPKLAEYNADTPTILVETGLGQHTWFDLVMNREGENKESWQFNNIEKNLLRAWATLAASGEKVYLAGPLSSVEEREHLNYLSKMAVEAGIQTHVMDIADLEISQGRLVNGNTKAMHELTGGDSNSAQAETYHVKKLFKLYPYEWLSHEELGRHFFGEEYHPLADSNTRLIEPPWKLILGNKALLALLWSLFPGHPNLLPAYFELSIDQLREDDYVAKPKYGREGQGIVYSRKFRFHQKNKDSSSGSSDSNSWESAYGADGMHEFLSKAEQNLYIGAEEHASAVYLGYPVFQKHFDTARFSNRHIVIGSWVIGGVPSGFNFREDSTETTQDDSCFVPCYIRGQRQDFDHVRGTNFTDKQRALYKELYGMELKKPADESAGASTSSNSSGRSGTSGGGGGGGFWGSWFRSFGNNKASDDGKKDGSSGTSGSTGGTGGTGGNTTTSGTSNPSGSSKTSASAAEQHKKAAENFRHKIVKNGVFRPRTSVSGSVKSTGSSHKTVSRSGGGGRG